MYKNLGCHQKLIGSKINLNIIHIPFNYWLSTWTQGKVTAIIWWAPQVCLKNEFCLFEWSLEDSLGIILWFYSSHDDMKRWISPLALGNFQQFISHGLLEKLMIFINIKYKISKNFFIKFVPTNDFVISSIVMMVFISHRERQNAHRPASIESLQPNQGSKNMNTCRSFIFLHEFQLIIKKCTASYHRAKPN